MSAEQVLPVWTSSRYVHLFNGRRLNIVQGSHGHEIPGNIVKFEKLFVFQARKSLGINQMVWKIAEMAKVAQLVNLLLLRVLCYTVGS